MKKLKMLLASLIMVIVFASSTYAAETLKETYDMIPLNGYTNLFKN